MEKKEGAIKKMGWSQMNRKFKKVLAVLRQLAGKVGRLSFWGVALSGLALRLFIIRPLGALLALAAGSVWIYYNIHLTKQLLLGLLSSLTRIVGGDVETSLWFDHGGCEKILALITRLSKQGVNCCNLAEQIDDLPPENHWCAISKGLREKGIITQATRGAFYINWHLPKGDADAGTDNTNAA